VDLAEQDCRIINSLGARVGISYGTGRLLKVDFGGLLDIGFAASRLRGFEGMDALAINCSVDLSEDRIMHYSGTHLQTYRWMSLA
jgi:hypothetical protein